MLGGCETLTTIRSKPIVLPEVLETKPPAAVSVEHLRGNVVADANDHGVSLNENDSQLQLENRDSAAVQPNLVTKNVIGQQPIGAISQTDY